MSPPGADRAAERWGLPLTFGVLVVLQGAWLALAHPALRLDPDLLSYLTHWRDWRAGVPASFGYTVPKVLPFLLFGAAGSPEFAQALSILCAAAAGAALVDVSRRSFGIAAGLLVGLFYLLDPLRVVLMLRSSADLLVGVGLILAAWAWSRGHVRAAGLALLVAALAKPMAVPCGLVLLLPQAAVPLRRRCFAAALPVLALGASVWLEGALAGRGLAAIVTSPVLPTQHIGFAALAAGGARDGVAALRLIVGEWMGGLLFARSWPLIVAGAVVLAARSWRGEPGARAARVLVVAPILLVATYALLAWHQPIAVYTRFAWPLTVAAAVLAALALTACGALLARRPTIALAVSAGLACLVLLDREQDWKWRAPLMVAPWEANAAAVEQGLAEMAAAPGCAAGAVVPLAYLPLARWRLGDGAGGRTRFCALEDWAEGRGCTTAQCALLVAGAPTTPAAQARMSALLAGDSSPRVIDGRVALVAISRPGPGQRRPSAARSHARVALVEVPQPGHRSGAL